MHALERQDQRRIPNSPQQEIGYLLHLLSYHSVPSPKLDLKLRIRSFGGDLSTGFSFSSFLILVLS